MTLEPSAAGHALSIRTENAANLDERASIRAVNTTAFGRSEEADLVDKLRAGKHALVSLVAELDGAIVGHVMFSRMSIDAPPRLVSAVALAPVAVLPEYQRQGIGGLLIQHGLKLLRDGGESIVIVVGHPHYYARFGFSSDTAKTLESPFPREASMALELVADALHGIRGSVVYAPPFGI